MSFHKASCGNVVVFSWQCEKSRGGKANESSGLTVDLPERMAMAHSKARKIDPQTHVGSHTSLVGSKKKSLAPSVLCVYKYIYIHIHIPGTQMTSIFEGQPLKNKAKLRTKKKGRFGFQAKKN